MPSGGLVRRESWSASQPTISSVACPGHLMVSIWLLHIVMTAQRRVQSGSFPRMVWCDNAFAMGFCPTGRRMEGTSYTPGQALTDCWTGICSKSRRESSQNEQTSAYPNDVGGFSTSFSCDPDDLAAVCLCTSASNECGTGLYLRGQLALLRRRSSGGLNY